MRIAIVGPVAQSIPPARTGSVETVTALLVDGLVERGHDVTLFATGDSGTRARLHTTFARGYHDDPELWPWDLCELLNLSAAVDRADAFDVIHYQAEYAPLALAFAASCATPVVTTVHHAPSPSEVALWSRAPRGAFIAISEAQAALLSGLRVEDSIPHAVDPTVFVPAREPGEHLVYLGRFTEGKGVLDAIEVARRVGRRLLLAGAENDYYREAVAPHVDGDHVRWVGEVGPAEKVALLGGAAALLYLIREGEPFGLVLAEAMACGTPVAALRKGAVTELVDEGVTGGIFDDLDAVVAGLPDVLGLDRAGVRTRALERFSPARMVDAHVEVYARLVAERKARAAESSLLAVFAHPDDESLAAGGLLALAAAERVRVSILCLTRGEGGPGESGPGRLGDVRASELRAAAEALGAREARLLDHGDGMLPWVDPGALEADVLAAIERTHADVVVTFDEDGLYWHPDHVAVHRAVTDAVASLGPSGPALYYASMPPGVATALVEAAGDGGSGLLGVTDPEAFGAAAPEPSLVVDAGPLAERKVEALRCHRSQVAGGVLETVPAAEAARLLAVEHYRRADVGARGDTFVDRLGTPARAGRR